MSWFGDNAAKGLDTLMGTIMLYDRRTGAPTALLDGSSITGMRTGAAGAIGSSCLARKDSRTLLMVGAGNQAPYQLAAHLLMFDTIRTVYVYDPMSYEASVKFCSVIKDRLHRRFLPAFEGSPAARAALEKKYDIEYLPVKNLEQAVGKADIIVTVTPSRKPMVMRGWLRPGTHLSCMGADMQGKQEIDENIFPVARVFVDDIAKTSKTGEMEIPIQKGVFAKEEIVCEIGKVLQGKNPGRLTDDEITLFDATGLAAQDLLTAKELLLKAERLGFGTVVEL
jgi:alanine dehydrogenase